MAKLAAASRRFSNWITDDFPCLEILLTPNTLILAYAAGSHSFHKYQSLRTQLLPTMIPCRKLKAKKSSKKAAASLPPIGHFNFPTPARRRVFRIFDLPPELRTLVFEWATVRDVMKLVKSRPRRAAARQAGSRKCFLDGLLISKQWYRDFSELFISLKCFEFRNTLSLMSAVRTWPDSTARYVRAISWHARGSLTFPAAGSLHALLRRFPNLAYANVHVDISLMMSQGLGRRPWEVQLDMNTALSLPGFQRLEVLLSRIEKFRLVPEKASAMSVLAFLDCHRCISGGHNPPCLRRFQAVFHSWLQLWLHLISLMRPDTRPACPQGHPLTIRCVGQKHFSIELLFSSRFDWSHFSEYELDAVLRN